MTFRQAALALALAVGCTSASSTPARDAAPAVAVALTNVTVVDGTGAAPQHGMTIVVQDGRIASVAPAAGATIPAGAEVHDLSGHTVIPGLIDAHVHLASFDRGGIYPALLKATLMGGVTTVRDMGGNARVVVDLARSAHTDSTPAPRIWPAAVVAGPRWFANYDSTRVRYWSDGHRPGTAPGVRLLPRDADSAAVEEIVLGAKRLGVAGVKVYDDVAPPLLAMLARAAHRHGLPVWAHAIVPPTGPLAVVEAGADAVSHADMPVWAAAAAGDTLGNRATRLRLFGAAPPDSPRIAALLQTMRERGTVFDPTLFVMYGPITRDEAAERRRGDALLQWAAGVTRQANRLGVPVAAGTDAIGTYTPNIHAELQLLVDAAGFTPLEALRSATQYGARALGAEDSLGTIAPGKLADLVVLRADPSTDIRNTQTVAWVMRGGALLRRDGAWRQGPLTAPAR